MKESIKHIGKALKQARISKKLSQSKLSEKVKIPQTHISKIENGEVDLQTSTLIELSRALNLELMLVPINKVPTVTALLTGEGAKQRPMYSLDEESEENG